MPHDDPDLTERLPLSALPGDPRVQSALSRALTAVGIVVVVGAIALSVWAAGA